MARALVPAAIIATGAMGASGAFAATSGTQNVTFSAPTAVSITSGGTPAAIGSIDPSSGSPTGTTSGTLTLKSNDLNGIQLNVNTAAATVTESGGAGCVPVVGAVAAVGVLTVAATAVTGGSTAGVAGTPAAAVTLSTTNAPLYTAVPTKTGTMGTTLTYVATPGFTTPANSANCSYTIPVTFTIVAQ